MPGIIKISGQSGYTMIELVIVIIVIGILAGVATMKLTASLETAKFEATRAEMEQLACAIVGNVAINASGAQNDFGYIGDVGAMPPNLDALVINPGYTTWNGPYISKNQDNDDFKKDAWNKEYIFVDTLLQSTGSGSNIDLVFASSAAALFENTISGYLVDAGGTPPGTDYADSIAVQLLYPDGAGGMATAISPIGSDGSFEFSTIPIGDHILQAVYIPDNDTIEYHLNVNPGKEVFVTVAFPADLW
jgi:prepilin-type N-terminal cleavage/methylation domain-containing protein